MPNKRNSAEEDEAETETDLRSVGNLDFAELAEMVGFMMRVVQLQMVAKFYRQFGHHGMKAGTFAVLTMIQANPGIRQSVLGSAMVIKGSNLTKLVQGLERIGYIERRIPPGDRRSASLFITDAGREAIAPILEESVAADVESTSPLSVHERQILLGLIGKLNEGLRAKKSQSVRAISPKLPQVAPAPTSATRMAINSRRARPMGTGS
jgi:DNA-binding MarR family transcriptional regulator